MSIEDKHTEIAQPLCARNRQVEPPGLSVDGRRSGQYLQREHKIRRRLSHRSEDGKGNAATNRSPGWYVIPVWNKTPGRFMAEYPAEVRWHTD